MTSHSCPRLAATSRRAPHQEAVSEASTAAGRNEPELFHPERLRQPTVLATAIDLLVGAAVAHHRRLGPIEPEWALTGILTCGRLLPVPLCT